MNYELDKGSLFMTIGDKTMSLGDGVPFTEEIELSAAENLSHIYRLNNTPSFSFELYGVDLANLNDFYKTPQFNGNFVIEAYISIMIQARWHKKPRIRKKWLKRFGIKPDTVKIRANATTGEYHNDDGSFEFKTDVPEYLWRPDQKRKGLRIIW